jgi:cellulose synthase/poly-beta-1,6-N-acetylglucosamine synthase-like glycosyltransferase
MVKMMLTISVIIPVEPEGSAEKVLNSLKSVDYPQDLIEVFVVEGKQPSRQRNKALKEARGKIVYFLDSDSIVDKDLFKKVVRCYLEKDIAALGGPNLTPETDSFLQKCFGYVLSSSFGVSKIRNRYKSFGEIREADESELILCNLSFKRSVLKKEGAFNESLYPNEENELINRLRKRGYKLIYHPQAIIYRSRRNSIPKYFKQIFNYGRGRAEQTFIDPAFFNPFRFIPLFFSFYLISLFFFHNLFYLAPFYFYLALNFVSTLFIAFKEKKWGTIFLLPILFLLTHLAYGLGLLWGIIRIVFKLRKCLETKVSVYKIKKFGEMASSIFSIVRKRLNYESSHSLSSIH